MIKHLILFSLLSVIILGLVSCSGGLADGNLIGVVVREGTGDPIPGPVIIIGRAMSSPTVPDQMIFGDIEGRFDLTLPGGNYTVQIGTNQDGPFYTLPDPVYVQENHTTVVLWHLPVGF